MWGLDACVSLGVVLLLGRVNDIFVVWIPLDEWWWSFRTRKS